MFLKFDQIPSGTFRGELDKAINASQSIWEYMYTFCFVVAFGKVLELVLQLKSRRL